MKVLEYLAAWLIPTRILLAIVGDDPRVDTSKVPRTWLPPKWIGHPPKMKGDNTCQKK
jgi:hypothetical protein